MTHVRFDRAALSAALNVTSKVKAWAPPRWSSIQIKNSDGSYTEHWRAGPPLVEIVADGHTATVRAANFDRQLVARLACEGEGTAVVPVTMLASWVERLGGATVDMQILDGEALFTSARNRATLRTWPVAHYPPARNAPAVMDVPLARFLAGLTATVAVPKDGADQAAGRGVHIAGTADALRFFASEHGRAHEQVAAGDDGVQLIVPVEACRLFLAVCGQAETVTIAADDRSVGFTVGEVTLTSTLIDAVVAKVDGEFARPRRNVLKANAADLLSAIELAVTVADSRHRDFELHLGPRCYIQASSQGGRDVGVVDVFGEWVGDAQVVAFALLPVRDALTLFGGGEIEWRMAGPFETTVIASVARADLRALVAPFLPKGEEKAKAA